MWLRRLFPLLRRAPGTGQKGQRTRKGAAGTSRRQPPAAAPATAQHRTARPIVLFLVAKVVAYTVLGFLLGLLGSVFQLTPTMRVALQVGIGIFMVGNALRMLNVHPIFRYFVLEPPRFITRYIRRKSKGDVSDATPLFLGAMTVFIPCGVTQAMMAVAMASATRLSARRAVRLHAGHHAGLLRAGVPGHPPGPADGEELHPRHRNRRARARPDQHRRRTDACRLPVFGDEHAHGDVRTQCAAAAAVTTDRPLHTDPLAEAGSPGAAPATGAASLAGGDRISRRPSSRETQPGTVVIDVRSKGYFPGGPRKANQAFKPRW